jgi:hypothetical protein
MQEEIWILRTTGTERPSEQRLTSQGGLLSVLGPLKPWAGLEGYEVTFPDGHVLSGVALAQWAMREIKT